jgi:outer membrane protein assembly factor BamB
MSTEVLIELDTPAAVPDVAVAPPARRYRALGLALCAVLVLAVAGSVPAVTPMWRRAGVVPAVPGDGVYAVAGGRLYVSVAEGGRRVTSAYAMHPMRRLWTARTADDIDAPPRLAVFRGGLIVQNGKYTDILDARTGAVRWSSPVRVLPLPGGRTGLVVDPQFSPGTEYDESSGAPGMLYFALDGTSHTRPPERTVLRGVDLATGRQRWSTSLPGAIYASPATAQPATVVVVSSQRLEVRDADSGAVRRQQPMPVDPRRVATWSEVVGDLLLVSSTTPTGDMTNAYALDTLRPRWQRTLHSDSGNTRNCTGLPCERRSSTLMVLDPATGAARWESEGWVDLVAWAGQTLVFEGSGRDSRPVRVVNAATGAPQVDLSPWQAVAERSGDAPLVLSRTDFTAGTTFGVLRPGQRTVRELGHTDGLVQSCRSDAEVVACRSEQGIEVFVYRS